MESKKLESLTGFKVFLALVTLFVATTIGYGLYLSGSPTSERLRALDEQRSLDLMAFQSSVDAYVQSHNKLPEDVSDLMNTSRPIVGIVDPVSHQPYEYSVLNSQRYLLCATFDTDSTGQAPGTTGKAPLPKGPVFTKHPRGHYCFEVGVALKTGGTSGSSDNPFLKKADSTSSTINPFEGVKAQKATTTTIK
jgi:hypothetical protein